jgi:hypothetical protein
LRTSPSKSRQRERPADEDLPVGATPLDRRGGDVIVAPTEGWAGLPRAASGDLNSYIPGGNRMKGKIVGTIGAAALTLGVMSASASAAPNPNPPGGGDCHAVQLQFFKTAAGTNSGVHQQPMR